MASTTLIRWQRAMLILVAGLPLLALIFGWGLDAAWFRRLRPEGLAPMSPTTALSFILFAGALLARNILADRSEGARTASRPLRIASLLLAAIAGANLTLQLLGGDGLDGLLLPGRMRSFETMSAATSVTFLLAAGSGMLITANLAETRLFGILTTTGVTIATVALVGHLLGADEPYTAFIFAQMPPRTGLAMLLLFLAMMMGRTHGWVPLLLGDGAGSRGARRLFPVVVIGPPLLLALTLVALRAGLFSSSVRATALAITMMGGGLIATLRNARMQNQIEARLKGTLAKLKVAVDDKEILLREVYHRVKNNLQATDALISIESTKFTDPEVLDSFRAMGGRVQALATVHQLLIQSDRPSRISTVAFLSELCASIEAGNGLGHEGGGSPEGIRLIQDVEDDELDLDAAIQVGLLVNELIANAIKHGFAGRERGTIVVRYRSLADDGVHRSISVIDDGIGIQASAAREPGRRQGIGTRLIRGIVAQLKGELTIDTEAGTAAHILFPLGNR